MSSASETLKDAQLRRYERAASVVFLKTNEGFGGLSNMASGFPLKVNGLRIFTSEALYQACRFPHRPEVQRLIIGQASPMTAKMKSKPYRHDSRPDWERVRVKIMRWCLHVKLAQNWDAFNKLLLKTGDRPIVEQSRKDAFWGAKETEDGTLVGRNVLGRLLMELREAVKTGDKGTLLRVEPLQIPDFLLDGRLIRVVQPVGAEKRELSPRLTGDGAPGTAIGVGMRGALLFDPQAVKEASSPEYASESPRSPGIADLKPYPAMKDSGLPWLGRIPKHWEVRRFKYLLREVNSRSSDGQDQLLSVSQYTGVTLRGYRDGGDEPDTRAASLVGYKRVAQDDLVVNIMLAWNGSLGVAHSAGIVSPAYCVYRFNDNAEPWYYHNLLRLPLYKGRIKVESTGVVESRLRLYSDDLFRIEALVPPKKEQAAIAHFASAIGRQVDRLIRAKRRLIELLNEQKRAIIRRAVIRGLVPNVRLKPSGIDWLGDVSEHWEVSRIKVEMTCLNHRRVPLSSVERGSMTAREYDYYGASGVIDRVDDYLFNDDLILIAEDGANLVLRNLPLAIIARGKFWVNNHAHILKPNRGNLEYLANVLECIDYKPWISGAAQPKLTKDRLMAIAIAVPPVDEQDTIITQVHSETVSLRLAITRAQSEINLLREFRTRLIADVVTGKLDVRSVELPKLYEAEAVEGRELGEEVEVDETGDTEETADGDEQ